MGADSIGLWVRYLHQHHNSQRHDASDELLSPAHYAVIPLQLALAKHNHTLDTRRHDNRAYENDGSSSGETGPDKNHF